MVSVGETGDFKFVSPNADISGLTRTIYTMADMLRINHGLRPKHDMNQPTTAAAAAMEKLGVVEQNIKRSQLFKEREQQLFQVVKKLWNIHHAESSEETFSEDAELDVYYVQPEFAVDPVTKMNAITQEQKIIDSGDTRAIKKLFPHLDDVGVAELLDRAHKDRMAQAKRSTEHENFMFENSTQTKTEAQSKQDSSQDGGQASPKAKPGTQRHAQQSSIQPGKTGDTRKSDRAKRREDQRRLEVNSDKK